MTNQEKQSAAEHTIDSRTVATVESVFHAQTLVAILEDNGIEAIVAPHTQQGASIHPTTGNHPVRILTNPNDVSRARDILKQNAEDAAHIDWSELPDDGPEAPDHERFQRETFFQRMPAMIKLGFIAAVVLVALLIAGSFAMLFF